MIDIRYSNHARLRMIERGISDAEVKAAIAKGSKRRQDGNVIASYSYIEVVYKRRKDGCYVITVMVRW